MSLDSIPNAVLRLLESIVVEPDGYEERTVFDVKAGRDPTISFSEFYYERLIKYMLHDVDEIVCALALSLVIRVTAFGAMPLTRHNIHRLFSTALVVSIKFLMDTFKANSYYAKVIGVSNQELNRLEADLLKRLDYRIQTECTAELINEIMQYQEITYIKKLTPRRIQQFIKEIQDCRLQQLRQKQEGLYSR